MNHLTNLIMGILYGFSLQFAGSEGPWFPWANITGVLIFIFTCLISKRFYRARLRGASNGPLHTSITRPPLTGKVTGFGMGHVNRGF